MAFDGDAAAVVDDLDRSVAVEHDLDAVAVTGRGLVDRVVDQLPHEVGADHRDPVPPMYMPGRLRTASRPSSVWIASASYPDPFRVGPGFSLKGPLGPGFPLGPALADSFFLRAIESLRHQRSGPTAWMRRSVCTETRSRLVGSSGNRVGLGSVSLGLSSDAINACRPASAPT